MVFSNNLQQVIGWSNDPTAGAWAIDPSLIFSRQGSRQHNPPRASCYGSIWTAEGAAVSTLPNASDWNPEDIVEQKVPGIASAERDEDGGVFSMMQNGDPNFTNQQP